MINKKISIYIYKKISKLYVLLFGRKSMQFFNDCIFSLSLDAKGYKNYGNFNVTGEKSFIKLIRNEIDLSLDIGANIGEYTKLLLLNTNSKVVSFEPLPEAFKELEKVKVKFKDRLNIYNVAIGIDNNKLDLFYGDQKSEKASLVPNLEKLSFVGLQNKNKISVDVKKLDSFENFFNGQQIDFIKIDDILYFESDGRYTIIHLIDKTTFFVSKNIGEYDKILAPRYFFRIHKKYLINLKYIVNINNADGSNCELIGNLILPVAKRRKEDLVSFLNIK